MSEVQELRGILWWWWGAGGSVQKCLTVCICLLVCWCFCKPCWLTADVDRLWVSGANFRGPPTVISLGSVVENGSLFTHEWYYCLLNTLLTPAILETRKKSQSELKGGVDDCFMGGSTCKSPACPAEGVRELLIQFLPMPLETWRSCRLDWLQWLVLFKLQTKYFISLNELH